MIEVNELAHESPGPIVTEDGNREWNRRFEVITNSVMSGIEVLAYSGLPRLYFPHSVDISAFCVKIDPKKSTDSEYYWVCEYKYSTKTPQTVNPDVGQNPDEQAGDPSNANPLLRTPTYRFSSRKMSEFITQDLKDNVMTNSANEAYDPIERPRSLLVLNFSRNIHPSRFQARWISEFVYATNLTDFLGWAPHEVLIDEINGEPKKEFGIPFWELNVVFVFNPFITKTLGNDANPYYPPGVDPPANGNLLYRWGGWVTRRVDAGYMMLDANDNQVPIIIKGQVPNKPQLLNNSGGLLTSGGIPYYREFFTYQEKDFNLLNLFN